MSLLICVVGEGGEGGPPGSYDRSVSSKEMGNIDMGCSQKSGPPFWACMIYVPAPHI